MSADTGLCLHCGTPVPPDRAQFCCAGCEHVYNLLLTCGLQNFYDLRGNATLAPVPPQALRDRDWQWLSDLATQAEACIAGCGPANASQSQSNSVQLDLAVQGMSCLGCVWLIESVFKQIPGAQRIEIHAVRATARLTWQRGAFDIVDFARRLQQFGYLLGKPDSAPVSEGFTLGRRTGLCAAFALNAMAFSLPAYLGMDRHFVFAPWFDLIAACSATLALLVGGSYFAQRSIAALRRGVLHIDTPITIGVVSAFVGSMIGWIGGFDQLKYFDFVAIFIFLMLAGRWLQQAAVERNRRRLLQNTTVPESVGRLDETGDAKPARLSDIARGDVIAVRSGEVFPLACSLRSPHAMLSLEWINGESEARERGEGQLIPSGALNIGSATVEAEALETWNDSLLHQLANAKSGSEASPFFGGLLRGYLAAVVLIGISGFIFWLASGHGAARALQVMISVFVVSCPCALGVAVPFADDFAASWMERLGVFVRNGGLWQKLARVRTLVFDKTGTLTMENPQLANPGSLAQLDDEARSVLQALVASNLHPVSRSLFEALGANASDTTAKADEVAGHGLQLTDARGRVWSLGRPGWMTDDGASGDAIFSRDGLTLAAFRFQEALRPETVDAFNALRREGFDMHLLSGDRTGKVAETARTLGLSRSAWHSQMTPAEKAAHVRSLDNRNTLYLGDGANDSLAFEAALCTGSPVTGRNFLEHKADFYFLGNSLRFVPQLLQAARDRQRAVRRIFAFALSYNIATVAVSLSGHMSPLLAAVLMPLSSIATIALVRLSFKAPVAARNQYQRQSLRSAPQGMVGDNDGALVT